MATTDKEIIILLEKFGLSTNAARAYISLLQNNPATGYEISKDAGIPRSAIYATLNRLEKMGIVNSEGDSPKRFVPLSPYSLIEHLQNLHEDQLDGLKSALDKLDLNEEAFDFWHIHGYDNLIYKMREVINNAKSSIIINVWNSEFKKVHKELNAAHKRNIDIIVFSFSEISQPIGTTVSYQLKEEDIRQIWKPKIVLVVDHKLTIMGSASEQNGRAIWTSTPAITKIASNYIVLDITLAGQRLDIDINPIVKNIMQKDEFDLDRLIDQVQGQSNPTD